MVTGTFETFDMDLNVVDRGDNTSFKVRRVSTPDLLRVVFDAETKKRHKAILTEMCNRFLSPIMNLILAALCATILLRTSLLRRRASFAPMVAVGAMAGVMGLYMSLSNMVSSLTGFGMLAIGLVALLVMILAILAKK